MLTWDFQSLYSRWMFPDNINSSNAIALIFGENKIYFCTGRFLEDDVGPTTRRNMIYNCQTVTLWFNVDISTSQVKKTLIFVDFSVGDRCHIDCGLNNNAVLSDFWILSQNSLIFDFLISGLISVDFCVECTRFQPLSDPSYFWIPGKFRSRPISAFVDNCSKPIRMHNWLLLPVKTHISTENIGS
jgi:hypothetical protein